ncbi:MAG: alpha-galactosidase [Chloroflexi bacterium]|nr:alpha-galactosidase [Chloroflexota bacterium]
MPFTLSNPHLHFTLDESTSTWSLFTQKSETPSIEGARFNGYFRFDELNRTHLGGLRTWQWRGWLDGADIFQRGRDSAHGELKTITARIKSGIESLAITVEFALPTQHPFLLITIRVQNVGSKPFRVSRLNSLFAGPLHRSGAVRLDTESSPLTFFSNGWQSWSYAGTLNAKQTQPYTNLGIFQSPVNHNSSTPRSEFRSQFSGDMFGVLSAPQKRNAIIAGFISQREQFGSVDVVTDSLNPSLRLRAQCDDVVVPPNGELITDAAYVQLIAGYDDDPLRDYAEAVARENNARVPAETPIGWCSWYHYFDKVSEDDLRANLIQIEKDRARLPLTLIQLDDGFEANVGDWEANSKFPSGLRAVADSIRASNFVPGVWLAPFIAKPDSKLAREHGEWFIKSSNPSGFINPKGFGLANAGFVFNTFCRGLDTTHPAAQDFTRDLISKAVNEWGYSYLKLDFLYAAALKGKRYDSTVTRAQALRKGLEIIREAAGEKTFLLGCGCPLGTAVGIVDAMRISADVAPDWKPKFLGLSLPFRDEKGMPSTENAIRNTITRAPLHKRWWLNDPDCLLVRESTNLSLDEVQALASVIALSGGMFMVSDDMTALSEERRKIIEKVMPIEVLSSKFEVGSGRLEIRDWLESEMPEHLEAKMNGVVGEWKVVGLFNWSGRKTKKQLNVEGESHVWDF